MKRYARDLKQEGIWRNVSKRNKIDICEIMEYKSRLGAKKLQESNH